MLECETENVIDLEAVAVCCRVLGALFYLPPDNPAVESILDFLGKDGLVQTWPLAPGAELREIERDMVSALSSGEDAMQRLVIEHQRLFIGPDHLEAPPWGSVYLEAEGTLFGESTQAFRDFLESEGIDLNTDQREPADHIGLLFWAAAWLAEQDRPRALHRLLEDHLLTWSGVYLEKFEQASRHPFHKSLARLASITLQELRNKVTSS